MPVMSIAEFRDSDSDYLGWVAAHGDGYVVNIGRSGRGYARLHRAGCPTITSRPPFTRAYIKVCSASLAELDRWALGHAGAVIRRCGTCQPQPGAAALPVPADGPAEPEMAGGRGWEIEGPGGGLGEVWLWAGHYIPFERLSAGQRDARDALRLRVGALAAGTGEILDASYAGARPPRMDVENLVLYNIDAAAGGCFQSGARCGVRFEMAGGPRRDPPSGRRSACSYRYRLIRPGSELSYWRPARRLASFAGAGLGRFPASRRLEQAWRAIHRTEAEVAGPGAGEGTPFAVFLTLGHPRGSTESASPELVKALIDGTVAAFQAHGSPAGAGEIAARVAAGTGWPSDGIAQMLTDDRKAVLGVTGKLAHLRGAGVQWNPADHLCVAAQVLCAETAGDTWTLSGDIHAVEPRYAALPPEPGMA
jgi:hypothetical protein